MMSKRNIILLALIFVFAGLVFGLAISSNLGLQFRAFTQESGISSESSAVLSKTGQAMAEVAAFARPAVVNISSTRTIKIPGSQSPFFNDPFLRRFFGDEFGQSRMPREYKQSGLGSGVIVDSKGYILTNNHVVSGADEIQVKLSDKREFKGKVIGTDPHTDLAVIKIDSAKLPVLKIGNSALMKVGETVIAIGNPFGLNQTVTSGIVSATGRADVGIADYEDFIQTDAAINPGNSGGALVNVKGELIGINTAIFSASGGYEGIGFAIPSNMAKVVMENLITKGKVVRGWLGVSIQPVTPDLAKQFGFSENAGALVGDVFENGPADKAGIRRGDIIVKFDGKDVKAPADLRNSVAATSPGKTAKVEIIRDSKKMSLDVVISELSAEPQVRKQSPDQALKGWIVRELTPDIRKSLHIPKRITGVIVSDIEADSPAAGILMPRDIVMEVNRKRISSVKDFQAAISRARSGENLLLLVYRNGSAMYVSVPN
ncbi:MAG: DegQ family serine endoprotease [Nitrospiraceae bacterium]|nr:DegQ family serine endoprotease [Nitrospiraceae bacterium]